MSRYARLLAALIALGAGAVAIILGQHNILLRLLGTSALLLSVVFFRWFQSSAIAEARPRRDRAMLAVVIVLAAAVGVIAYALSRPPGGSELTSHLLLLATGMIGAVLAGALNYLAQRKNRPPGP